MPFQRPEDIHFLFSEKALDPGGHEPAHAVMMAGRAADDRGERINVPGSGGVLVHPGATVFFDIKASLIR